MVKKAIIIYIVLFLLVSFAVYAFTITLQRPAGDEVIGPSGSPIFLVNVTIDSLSNITLVNITIGGTEICSNNTLNLTEYTCVWNTNATGEGVFTVLANATNSSGGTAVDNSTNVTLDFTGPVTVIDEPPEDTNTTDTTPEINFTITDNFDPLINFSIFVDGGLNGQVGAASNNTKFALNLSTLTEGQHSIIVEATDDAGNSTNSTALTLNIDTTPPRVINLTPANTSQFNVSTLIDININVTDNTSVSIVTANITFPNATTQLLALNREGSSDIFNNTFTIPNATGQYNISFFANDTLNNINNSETTFFIAVDEINPSIINVTPLAGSTFNVSDVINISANVTDNVQVDIVQANITFPNASSVVINLIQDGSTITFNNTFTIPNAIGQYNVSFFANDTSNNINNTETTFFVAFDEAPPVVLNLTPLASSTFNVSDLINISANVTDNVGVDVVIANITLPNTTTLLINLIRDGVTDIFNNTFSIPNITGQYNVSIFANDTSNNINNSEVTFFVGFDEISPVVLNIIPPNSSTFNVSDLINISANVTDNVGVDIVIANITFPNASSVVINLIQDGSTDIFNNTFVIPTVTGQYNVSIFANDSSNNINNTESTFFTIVDQVSPAITLNAPVEGENFTAAPVTFNITVTDNLATTLGCNITVDNAVATSLTATNNVSTTSSATFTSGVHSWNATCEDNSGNSNTSVTRSFTVTLPAAPTGGGGRGGGGSARAYAASSIGKMEIIPTKAGTEVIIFSSSQPYILMDYNIYPMAIDYIRFGSLGIRFGFFDTYSLRIGHTISHNLTGDGKEDINITLNTVDFNSANITVNDLTKQSLVSEFIEALLGEEEEPEPKEETVEEQQPVQENPSPKPPAATGSAVAVPPKKSKANILPFILIILFLAIGLYVFRKERSKKK